MFTPQIFDMRNWLIVTLCSWKILHDVSCAKPSKTEGVVYPQLIESRDEAGQKVVKISDKLTLNLEKSSLVGKEFLLRTYQDDIMEHNYLDGQLLEEDLYHDPNLFASVIVSESNGLTLEGMLSPKYGIKPSRSEERGTNGNVPHVVYALPTEKFQRDTVKRPTTTIISPRQYSSQKQLSGTSKVNVELIIVVDSAFRKQFASKEELLRYLLITMNSVNMRYLTVSNPKVKIQFLALEVINHQVEKEFFDRSGWHRLHGFGTLMRLKTYVTYNWKKYASYDAVYLISGLDMGMSSTRGWESGELGISFIGGACTREKIAIGEDKAGTYMGVRITAHELGHVLGCPHDSDQYWLFSSKSCPWYDGFIMTYLSNSSNSMKFSTCCNDAITRLASSVQGKCLTTTNGQSTIPKKYYTREFPGEVLNRDEVCKLSFPDIGDVHFATDNGTARCYASCYSASQNKTLHTLLPDHSWCNETNVQGKVSRKILRKVCVNGDCRTLRRRYPVEPVKRLE